MPYLLYRMDISRDDIEDAQPLRFRAVVISDKMNIMDEIDIVCDLDEAHLPSPKLLDKQWISPKDLESTDNLKIDAFINQIREWVDLQQEKRRGTMVFVPSRGVEIDQYSLQEMMEKYCEEGYYFPMIKEPKVLDIQEYADFMLDDGAIPRPANNDEILPTDVFTIFYDLTPKQFLPFHLEVPAPGVKNLPAFNSSYEMIKWAFEKDKESIDPKALPNLGYVAKEEETLSQEFNENSTYKVGDYLSLINKEGEYQHYLVADIRHDQDHAYNVLIRIDNKSEKELRKLKKRHLTSDFMNEKGMVRIVERKDLLGHVSTNKDDLTDELRAEFDDKAKILLSSNLKKETKSSIDRIFKDKSKKKKIDPLSEKMRPSALLSSLLRDLNTPKFGFEKAEREVKEFSNLVGDATSYQRLWKNYLEKRKKALQSKIPF